MMPGFQPSLPLRFETSAGPLEAGDCLTSKEFLRRRECLTNPARIELIEGIVHIELPEDNPGARGASEGIRACLQGYSRATDGTEFGDASAVVVLDRENIARPDGVLRIAQDRGGRSLISEKGFITGAPELIAEVTLGGNAAYVKNKLAAFRRNGVQEYVIWRIQERRVEWFQMERGEYVLNLPGPNNILNSRVFPGLSLNVNALAANDTAALRNTLRSGLNRPEHSAFAERLASRKAKS